MSKKLEQNFSVEGIENVEIKIKEGAINVYQTHHEEVTITYKGGNLHKKLLTYKEANRYIIKQKSLYFPINIMLSQSQIDIGIPKNYKKSLLIKNSTGTVYISDISASNINVHSNAGLIDIDNIKFDYLNLKVGTRGCNVRLKQQLGDICIRSLVGKVNLSLNEVGGNLTLNSGTRGSTISIPENSPIKIKKTNNKLKVKSNISSEGKYIFDLKPNVGDVKLVNI